MKNSNFVQHLSLITCALIFIQYGCERPNPNKIAGDTSAVFSDCPTPLSTGSGGVKPNVSVSAGVTSGEGQTSDVSSSVSTGSGNKPQVEKTELDEREIDYSEALRTASILIVGNAPTLSQIYELGDLPQDQQQTKYIELIDKMLVDPRFADTLIEFYKYTFKMGGASTVPGEPTRDTAPFLAARTVYEDKDWRNILTQDSNTCPTFNLMTHTFIDGSCNNLPAGMKHSGILTDPGVHSLFFGNLSFRRNRFYHETFLCRSGNEQSGGEPTDMPPKDPPCSDSAQIPGYQNKWPVNEIAGACNGGRVDFHAYNVGNICSNCHSTWNHRAPLFSQFDSKGVYQMLTPAGEYAVLVPVAGSPKAKLSDWLCVGQTCPNGGNNTTAWKKSMNVDGVETLASAANLTEFGQQMSKDDEVIECAVKRIWNYSMGRADITEIGGRSWVSLPDRKDPNSQLLTSSKLVSLFKLNNYSLKSVFKAILVSDDFTRF